MEKSENKTEVTLWDLSSLPELQGVKEKQEALVMSNPYVSITDNVSYIKAKRHRTALVTGRTDLGKDKKLIYAKIKRFKEDIVDVETQNLIEITQVHEDKQQDEVKRWEAEKEQEKQERLEKERKRKDELQLQVINFRCNKRAAIETATFKTIDAIISDIQEVNINVEEYQADFTTLKAIIMDEANIKKEQLTKEDNFRVEKEAQEKERQRLAAERKKLDEEKALAEKERKALEDAAETRRKEAERLLAEDRKQLEAEKKALADAEDKRKAAIAKVENERKAKEEAVLKAKRDAEKEAELLKQKEAIKPDKEKLIRLVESFKLIEAPELKEERAIAFFNSFSVEINTVINKYESIITNL